MLRKLYALFRKRKEKSKNANLSEKKTLARVTQC